MVIAARYGTPRDVLEIGMATLPVVFLVVMVRGQRSAATVSIAGTLFGVYWIGFAFAHAELLRRLPHGDGVLIDILIGTFLADTAAYLGGRLFGRRPLAPSISPHKTVEGLFCGMLIAIVAVFVAGLYQPWLTQGTRCCSASRWRCWGRSETCSSRWSSATPGPRTPATCSGRTAARWTVSTR